MTTSESKRPVPAMNWAQQAGKVDEVRQAMERHAKIRRRRRRRAAAAAAALLLFAALAVWQVPVYFETETLTTLPAHRRDFVLKDGTRVELNAHTELKTDFRFGRRSASLLSGEAFFAVAGDPGHPFRVTTAAGTIDVLGTRFNVRAEGAHTDVTLVDGRIRFTASGDNRARPLAPGQQLTAEVGRLSTRALGAGGVEAVLAWRTGHLALSGLTLAEAADRFAAYHGKAITVAPSVARLPLGGTCSLDDLPGFFAFVRDALHVTVRPQSDGTYLIGK